MIIEQEVVYGEYEEGLCIIRCMMDDNTILYQVQDKSGTIINQFETKQEAIDFIGSMDKNYVAIVRVEWANMFCATSIEEAREIVKNSFEDEYGFRPTDSEILSISEKED